MTPLVPINQARPPVFSRWRLTAGEERQVSLSPHLAIAAPRRTNSRRLDTVLEPTADNERSMGLYRDSRNLRICPLPNTKPVSFLSPHTMAGIESTPALLARERLDTKLTLSTSMPWKSLTTLASARPAI